MTLLSGTALDPGRFFRVGSPTAQGSSFDLTVGRIFDHDGQEVDGLYTLKPGNMVQVVSHEVFKLGADVTGHVTYKTTMTRIGIWALTVGIVDPGWDGPIGTTLLNFGRNDYTIHAGDTFLRVSFFQHEPVPETKLRAAPTLAEYNKRIQKLAASAFPATFLNSDEIATSAGNAVLERIRREALVWIGGIALIFTVIQYGGRFIGPPEPNSLSQITAQVARLQAELDSIRAQLDRR